MLCLECRAELVAGYSECFACGAALPAVLRSANSPYHEKIRKPTSSTTATTATVGFSSPLSSSSSNYEARSPKQAAEEDYNSSFRHSYSTLSTSAKEFLKKEEEEKKKKNKREEISHFLTRDYTTTPSSSSKKQQQREVSYSSSSSSSSSSSHSAVSPSPSSSSSSSSSWHAQDNLYPWRQPGKVYHNSPSSSFSSRIDQLQQSQNHEFSASSSNEETQQHRHQVREQKPEEQSEGKVPPLRVLQRRQIEEEQEQDREERRQNQKQEEPQEEEHPGINSSSSVSSRSKPHHQHDQNNNNRHDHHHSSSGDESSSSSRSLPFSAHAAAFMIEMYARNIQEHMSEHRDFLLRCLKTALRERVAFEKASREIREAETFAAKAGAIRSMESSKVMQENADLRFELEEARDAVERQKEVTASVARELAEVKAQHETTMLAFQSLGPSVNVTS